MTPPPRRADPSSSSLPAPDIEFTASVEAERMRFEEVPETDVRFSGEPGHSSDSGTRRTNLPNEVEPGVVYRNVRVSYRLASRLTAGSGDGATGTRRHDQRA